MALFYSVSGVSEPFSALSVAPVSPAFATVLSTEMGRFSLPGEGDENLQGRSRGSLQGLQREAQKRYGEQRVHKARKPVLIAQQVMTRPAECIALDMPIREARELMQKKRFRHLPVISREGKLTGIVSDRDLLREGETPSRLIFQCMSNRVLTATPETPIRQIAEAFLHNRIGALPIVDEEHRVIGIITTTDILRAIVQNAPLELWA